MAKKMKFTQAAINKLPYSDPRIDYQDTETKYLYLRAGKISKTYFFMRRANGKLNKKGIGNASQVSLYDARKAADNANARIAVNDALKPVMASKLTLCDAYEFYCEAKGESKAQESLWRLYLSALGSVKLDDLSRDQIRRLLKEIGDKGIKTTANRVAQLIRAVITFAIHNDKWSGNNPAMGLVLYKEHARKRYLYPDEMTRFFDEMIKIEKHVMAKQYQPSCDAIRLLLLTGQRKANVLAMRWDELDLTHAKWTIPPEKFKSDNEQRVALSEVAMEILNRRKAALGHSREWVFPARTKGAKTRHLADIKKTFARIIENAKIENLTIHDLRRTFGSWLAADGVPLHIISKMLGHADTRITEKVYAHLDLSPLKNAAEIFSKRLPGK
ncbi:MAG: hypothetical protein A2020_12090 [Lentisphaerae bacterium GWF2_45_14]|nr:MAG: hypothetical protein A2020_12090 [Lentisphaerae bacterium GWF2_45_14]